MSENSEKNGPSVRPKVRTKQKTKKKKKNENCQRNLNDLTTNNNGNGLNNSAIRHIPNVQLPRAKLARFNELYYEELEGSEKEEVMVRIEKRENVHFIREEKDFCTFDSRIFASPQTTNVRLLLIPLLSCRWCLQLFNTERIPKFYDPGRSVCSKCLDEYTRNVPESLKPINIFNAEYAHQVHNMLKNCKLFNTDNPVYSELERALYNPCNYSNLTRSVSQDFNQKRYQLNEIIEHYKDFRTKNDIRTVIIYAAFDELYDFKKTFQTQDIIEWQQCLKKATSHLNRLWNHRSGEEFGKEEDWQLWSKRVYLHPAKVINRMILQKLRYFSFEYYAIVRTRKGILCYSKLCPSISNGFIIPSFSPEPPPLRIHGLATFFTFDPYSLKVVSRVYFEIPVCEEVVHGSPLKCCRFEIYLTYPTNAWNYVYLFLGNNQETYLGAEIEVTDDEIIFSYYLQDGKPTKDPKFRPPILELFEFPVDAGQGIAASHIQGRPSKLTIFKRNKPTKTLTNFFGYIETITLGSLLRIPLGMHRITACGIICDLSP